jgi:hypothetical protein
MTSDSIFKLIVLTSKQSAKIHADNYYILHSNDEVKTAMQEAAEALRKNVGYDKESKIYGFLLYEYPTGALLDKYNYLSFQSYDSNGNLIDSSMLTMYDTNINSFCKSKGRKPNEYRFKIGDIVEFISPLGSLYLEFRGIVIKVPISEEQINNLTEDERDEREMYVRDDEDDYSILIQHAAGRKIHAYGINAPLVFRLVTELSVSQRAEYERLIIDYNPEDDDDEWDS